MIPASATVPVGLAPFSMSYNGLPFGAFHATPYQQAYQLGSAGFQGLDLPAVASGDVGRPRDHGELIGLDLLRGRDITVDLMVTKSTGMTLRQNLDALADALTLGGEVEFPLFVQMTDGLFGVMARVRKRTFAVDQSYVTANMAAMSIMFHCTDPRIYDTPTQSQTVVRTVPTGGITFPVTFPLTFPGSPPPNEVTIDNLGNFNCYPVLTFTGPLTTPAAVLGSDLSLPALVFSNPASGGGFDLNAGDELVVDTQNQSVLLTTAGTTTPVDRRSWLVPGSKWWSLIPGVNKVDFTSSDTSTTTGTFTIEYASAYDSL